MGKNPVNAGDVGLIPGQEDPLQYSCLEDPMNQGAWQAIHGILKESHDLVTKQQQQQQQIFHCSDVP